MIVLINWVHFKVIWRNRFVGKCILVLFMHFSGHLHSFWVVIVFCMTDRSWDMVASQEYLPLVLKSYDCVNWVHFKVNWHNRFVGNCILMMEIHSLGFYCPVQTKKVTSFPSILLWMSYLKDTSYTLPNLSPLYLYRQGDSKFEESWVE